MSLVFNNVTFLAGYWGSGTTNAFGGFCETVSNFSITLNGTISVPGDTVSFITQFGGTGIATATVFDRADAIMLTIVGTAFVFSTVLLEDRLPILIPEQALGDFIVPCFAAGSRILTRRGEVAVETIQPGDEVVTLLGGGLAAVTWVGQRVVDCNALRHPAEGWPIRVCADAFAPGQPHADLDLSPDHAVHVDDVLIPIRYLENGRSICRTPRDTVTYHHIELAQHNVLLAQGLAAESFLDTGNKSDFASQEVTDTTAREAAARAVWGHAACAPLRTDGPEVRAVRTRLAARAASLGLGADAPGGLWLRAGGCDYLAEREGNVWHFRLRGPTDGARLVSPAFVPSVHVPGADDSRCLGVPVARLIADGQALAVDHPLLRAGWHAPEPGLRWTAGAAALPRLTTLTVELAALSAAPPLTAIAA